jgi:hypothetical protein
MRKFSYILFGIVVGAIAFNWAGWPFQLRFSHPHLNYWAYASLCVLLPFSMFISAMGIEQKGVKVIGLLLSVVLALPLSLLAFFAIDEAKDIMDRGEDYSFKLLDQASTSTGMFRLYLTDCGATCGHGLLLRKEFDTPIGIKLVFPEWSVYRQSEARLDNSPNSLKVVNGSIVLYEVAK